MWRKTAPQVIENDEGVKIWSGGRVTEIYSDGVREMDFRREVGVDAEDKTVFHTLWELPLRWNPPHENETVTEEEAQQIRVNLTEALAFANVRVVFSR